MSKVQNIAVTEAESGQKLLQFLRRRLNASNVPDSMLHRIIRSGEVRVDGARAKPFQRVEQGQIIRIPPVWATDQALPQHEFSDQKDQTKQTYRKSTFHKKPTVAPPRQPKELRQNEYRTQSWPSTLTIIAETPDILVLLKPAGLPVHPGTGHEDSLTTRLAKNFAKASFMPTPAHRLDKDTSGILLVAKTYTQLAHLHKLFAEKSENPTPDALPRKEYLAWVHGKWPLSPGPNLLEDRLEKKRNSDSFERVDRTESAHGRIAKAMVTPLVQRDDTTLLLINLLTGRTHQIRTQLALRGYPIIGDRKYGKQHSSATPLLLHAWRITLPGGECYNTAPEWHEEFDVSRVLESLES